MRHTPSVRASTYKLILPPKSQPRYPTPNEPQTASLDALPPVKPFFIEQQAKEAAPAVEEVKRQEAAEALASFQQDRPPQAPNTNMPKRQGTHPTQEYKRALSKCKDHKNADKDGLSAELVKLGGEAMETVFIKIFKRVLETGILLRAVYPRSPRTFNLSRSGTSSGFLFF
jgi:hypothetical protein